MKKVISSLMWLLLILTSLFPIGSLVCACFGYSLKLISVSAFAVTIAALSVCAVVMELVCKDTGKSKATQILSAVITPLSFINAVFYIFACPRIWVVASVFLCAGCCCYLTVKHGAPLVVSALIGVPAGFICLIALMFGGFGQNTVVQTVESPNGKYYAQVIDSDQGALGGDTLVDVYERGGINAIIFQMEKKPQRVYCGDWGEFKTMQIYWRNDECLVINSVEYEIE